MLNSKSLLLLVVRYPTDQLPELDDNIKFTMTVLTPVDSLDDVLDDVRDNVYEHS